MRKLNLTGKTFGRLYVTGEAGRINKRVAWACACACGVERTVVSESLMSGNTQSCGCFRIETLRKRVVTHGEVKRVDGRRVAAPEYRVWQLMKNRCTNPNSRDYRFYGGRGISVAPPWLHSYETFLHDVGRRPSDKHTLDREDCDGNYEPNNVRWATREIQAQNRSYASTKAWILAERLGLKKMTAHHMIWQVRAKDKGNAKWFRLSPESEKTVRAFLAEEK